MIVIINKIGIGISECIDSVYEVSDFKPLAKYTDYLKDEAESRKIKINPHYKNIMNKSFHEHLTDEEYTKESYSWSRFLKNHNYKWFIVNILKGKPIMFSTGIIYN